MLNVSEDTFDKFCTVSIAKLYKFEMTVLFIRT